MSRIKEVLQFQSRQDENSVEDRWLVDRLGLMPESKMASAEVEAGFSVEGVWHDKPMGYHLGSSGVGLHKDVWDNVQQRHHIFEYCPEIKMIMDMRFLREQCSEDEARITEEEKKAKESKEAEDKQKEEDAKVETEIKKESKEEQQEGEKEAKEEGKENVDEQENK